MATARQATGILDAILRLPDGTSRWHADRLRGAGNLPSTQGRPIQVTSADIAMILLSLLLGAPATSSAGLVPAYAELRPIDGGATLGDTLAGFIDDPSDYFELRLSHHSLEATLTFRRADHGMAVTIYSSDDHRDRPAFERLSVLGADAMTRLSSAIAAAPPVRVGRRRTIDRYRRIEF